MRSINRFLKRLFYFNLIFFGAFILLLVASGLVISKGDYYDLDDSNKYLIMGHSHAQCTYNDEIINGAQNLAQVGEAYFYTYLKLRKLLAENKNIEAVFLEFSNNQINTNMDDWTVGDEYISNKYPKYASTMSLDDFMLLFSENYKSIISVQPKTLFKNLKFILKNDDIVLGMNWGGYLKLKRNKVTEEAINLDVANPEYGLPVSTLNIHYLEKIVQLTTEKKIKLIFMRSPVHKKYQALKNEPQFQEIRKLKFSHIPFLDFKDYPLTNDEFGDLEHLNYKGANKFSLFFDEWLNAEKLGFEKNDFDLAK